MSNIIKCGGGYAILPVTVTDVEPNHDGSLTVWHYDAAGYIGWIQYFGYTPDEAVAQHIARFGIGE